MKRLKLLILTLLFSTIVIAAQETFDFSQPKMVDEFGILQASDIKARLDPAGRIIRDNSNLELFIIAYRDKNTVVGKVIRNFRMMKTYLLNWGMNPKQIITIDGGETSFGFGFQIWIVPKGQKPALLKSESNYLENTNIARKFDDYYYAHDDLEYDYWDGDAFTEFSEIIKKEHDSTAYVILYPEYNAYGYDKQVIRKDSLRKINKVKAEINQKLRKTGIQLSKIKIVNGGYRDYRQIELWILPKGVAPPAATPNQFPKTNKKSGK